MQAPGQHGYPHENVRPSHKASAFNRQKEGATVQIKELLLLSCQASTQVTTGAFSDLAELLPMLSFSRYRIQRELIQVAA